jgi:hypothetical protein
MQTITAKITINITLAILEMLLQNRIFDWVPGSFEVSPNTSHGSFLSKIKQNDTCLRKSHANAKNEIF